MKKLILFLVIAICMSACSSTEESSSSGWGDIVSVNQVGYLLESDKYFITNIEAQNFDIKESGKDTSVFNGSLELYSEKDKSTGEKLYIGYFSDFQIKGDFFIELDNGSQSYNFTIDDVVFNDVRDKSLKAFYYQRSGIDLLEEHAGIYNREAGHRYELAFHPESEVYTKGKTKDVSGGWYDAGDYGRYITPAAVSLGVMLIGYENYSEKFQSDNLNIPESSNSVPDFLDEMKYELDWMLKMQNREEGDFKGALPYMVNSKTYAWGMPANSSEKQLIYGFSSSATADFAAIMALANRVFKEFDTVYTGYSNTCLEASKLAWSYLERNRDVYPKGGYVRPSDTVTGGYAESNMYNSKDIDDRSWAAIELYRTTGEEKFLTEFNINFSKLTTWNTIWSDTSGYGKLQYLLTKEFSVDETIRSEIEESFLNKCDSWVNDSSSDGFKTVLKSNEYSWGNNGEVLLNRASMMIIAYQLTSNKKYFNSSLSQLNYVLGLNVHNKSFVAHTGTDSTRNIHHAMFYMKGYIFPGLIAGGPNSSLSDHIMKQEIPLSTPPAKCYLDNIESYASNENCILYNAPLVPVSAFFSS